MTRAEKYNEFKSAIMDAAIGNMQITIRHDDVVIGNKFYGVIIQLNVMNEDDTSSTQVEINYNYGDIIISSSGNNAESKEIDPERALAFLDHTWKVMKWKKDKP